MLLQKMSKGKKFINNTFPSQFFFDMNTGFLEFGCLCQDTH